MTGNMVKKVGLVVGIVAVLAVAAPGVVCLSQHLRTRSAADGERCCAAPQAKASAAADVAAGEKGTFQAGREVLFKVESLACPMVSGVGCGHKLAPMIGKMNGVEGVEEAFANWSGEEIRVVVRRAEEREATAKRVENLLSGERQKPVAVEGAELERAIVGQAWFGAGKIGELTSFEFRTMAKRRVEGFALKEKLADATKEKLLAIVEREWQKHGAHPGTLPGDDEGYGNYWKARLTEFKAAVAMGAKEILTAQEFEDLKGMMAEGGR